MPQSPNSSKWSPLLVAPRLATRMIHGRVWIISGGRRFCRSWILIVDFRAKPARRVLPVPSSSSSPPNPYSTRRRMCVRRIFCRIPKWPNLLRACANAAAETDCTHSTYVNYKLHLYLFLCSSSKSLCRQSINCSKKNEVRAVPVKIHVLMGKEKRWDVTIECSD